MNWEHSLAETRLGFKSHQFVEIQSTQGVQTTPSKKIHRHFKERFLPKDHPDRQKMDHFSAKIRKLGLREKTIGYGPSREQYAEIASSSSG